jgi:hypothetical protein
MFCSSVVSSRSSLLLCLLMLQYSRIASRYLVMKVDVEERVDHVIHSGRNGPALLAHVGDERE